MATAYFDCFSGISGDMVIGSFLDAGLDFSILEKSLGGLGLSGYELSFEKKLKCGISCTSFNVRVTKDQPHRRLSDIMDIIMRSSLDDKVRNDAQSVFTIIGRAEAKVHLEPLEDVHFHEVGAVDSIIDICGAALAFRIMDITCVVSSPVNTGRGMVRTEHGLLPVPAPAAAEILRSVPVYSTGIEGELATPTGAAILTYYAKSFSPMPEMRVESIGYGCGKKDLAVPNLLRVFIGL